MSPEKRIPLILSTIAVVALVVLAVVYLTTPAAHLPTWLPGHIASHRQRNGHVVNPSAHLGRGLAMLGAAAVLIGIMFWYAFRYEAAEAAPETTDA